MSAPPTNSQPGLVARSLTELKRLLVLAAVLGLVGVAGKYYCFDRLDEEIRVRVERLLRQHYQGLAVSVKSARRVAGQGIEIRGVRIAEVGDGSACVLVEIDEIFAVCDTQLPDFLTRTPQFTELRLRRLKLRAERKPSGVWNLAHLLPLPSNPGSTPPAATITDGALEIVDPSANPPCSWALRNLELTVQPERSSDSRIQLHIRGTLAGDHLDRVEIDGLLDPAGGNWDVRGAVDGLEFSPRLRAALPRELSDALSPLSSIRGRTYFGFHAQRAGRPASGMRQLPDGAAPTSTQTQREAYASRSPDEAPIHFTVHGKISEGRIDDARLPEPLTDVAARIRIDNHVVQIDELSARCGATQIELSATIRGYGRGPIDVSDLNVRQLQLERWPLASLPPQLLEAWRRFSPRGTVDVAGALRYDGRTWRPDVTVQCHDLSLEYDRFRYRVTDGTGTIGVQPDRVKVQLQCIGGGQYVRCWADVANPGPEFTGSIDIHTEGPIPIDDKLLAALDPSLRKLVRSFQPRGSAAVTAHFQRSPGEAAMHRRVDIQLHDCFIKHDRFRYPIDRVSGLLELIDDDWHFRRLAGQNDSAAIGGSGSYLAGPNGRELVLDFTASDVPLADELKLALPPGVQQLWANLRPRGNIDHLQVRLGYHSANQKWSIEVQGDKFPFPRNPEGPITLEPAWFRYALDDLRGSFHYKDGQVELKDLHAVHGQAAVSAAGVCRVSPDGSCRLDLEQLSADRVLVDQDLLAALPAGMSQSLGRFPLEGPLNVIGRLGLTVVPQPEIPPALDWNLSLVLADGRLATATPVESLHGGVRLRGRQGAEGLYCHGELQFDSAVVRGVQLTGVQGPFWFDGRRLVFGSLADRSAEGRAPQKMTAKLLGGRLALDGELKLGDESQFQVQAKLDNADLAEVARQLAPQQRGVSGRVFGEASVSGTALGKHTWRGEGRVWLREANIYQLPLMVRLLSLLSIKPPDRTAFTTSDIDFLIEGDDLTFTRIDFSGDAISLKGKGRINGQRQLDLKFYPIVGRDEWQWPLIGPLVGQTGREFMLIEVTGTLDRTDLKRTVFPRFDERLQQLFPELVRGSPIEPAMPVERAARQAFNPLQWLPRR
ncbi:MAG TPA: AsmA-like C-terminal region-containing protein [Pirellulaceae bacterium]|nr:AsmA-like C-terminal region-containing protein [Pirellulaceae bacterium]